MESRKVFLFTIILFTLIFITRKINADYLDSWQDYSFFIDNRLERISKVEDVNRPDFNFCLKTANQLKQIISDKLISTLSMRTVKTSKDADLYIEINITPESNGSYSIVCIGNNEIVLSVEVKDFNFNKAFEEVINLLFKNLNTHEPPLMILTFADGM